MSIILRPALFLDRDGVINIDHGYVYRSENFDFVEGIFDLVAAANQSGHLVIVVTNQAGIGRGYYTEDDFYSLTKWMREKFVQRGAKIDAVYFCPFHPEHGIGEYRRESDFRKPNPGMLLKAATEHRIDLARSMMIGDKMSDLEAGKRASVGKLVFFSNDSKTLLGTAIKRLVDAVPLLNQNES